jgi:beta-phosphoglucomutase-like phosphatase (HAD superfamily)
VFEQAIADAQAILNNEDSTAEEVAKAVDDLNQAIKEFDSFIVDYTVDKTALKKAIDEYTAIADSAEVGTEIGQTTQENIDALKSAINVAQQAMDGVSDTLNYDKQEDYEADVKIIADALQALEEAKAQYDENVVSSASFAKDKVAMYETAASLFLENIRKKINI